MSDYIDNTTLQDPSLQQLREETKKVMIPLLIKVFHARQEVQQLSAPPSRLSANKPVKSREELMTRLKSLHEELKKQELWIQSAQGQIDKVLSELENPTQPLGAHVTSVAENPSIRASFRAAIEKEKSSSTFSWLKDLLRIK